MVHQVLAFLAPDAVGKNCGSALGQLVSFHKLSLPMQDLSMPMHGSGRHFVVRPLLGETLEGGLVASFLLFPKSFVVTELQTMKIGIDQGVLVFVLLMKPQQILEQSDRLYLW